MDEGKEKAAREARRAQALRANLKRRKAASREAPPARVAPSAQEQPPDTDRPD
jgi:hypothetical protein